MRLIRRYKLYVRRKQKPLESRKSVGVGQSNQWNRYSTSGHSWPESCFTRQRSFHLLYYDCKRKQESTKKHSSFTVIFQDISCIFSTAHSQSSLTGTTMFLSESQNSKTYQWLHLHEKQRLSHRCLDIMEIFPHSCHCFFLCKKYFETRHFCKLLCRPCPHMTLSYPESTIFFVFKGIALHFAFLSRVGGKGRYHSHVYEFWCVVQQEAFQSRFQSCNSLCFSCAARA